MISGSAKKESETVIVSNTESVNAESVNAEPNQSQSIRTLRLNRPLTEKIRLLTPSICLISTSNQYAQILQKIHPEANQFGESNELTIAAKRWSLMN